MALTKRQKEFLEFLSGFLEKRVYSPSYEEVAEGLDLASLAIVHGHILALETKHYVKRGGNKERPSISAMIERPGKNLWARAPTGLYFRRL